MTRDDLVTIITPTFNSESTIKKTILSILEQSYQNWELIITDDCSTDNTVNIIKKYQKEDNRIKVFVLKRNSGAGIARNNSISNAQGRFIAFCDSDDTWLPSKLETQINFMRENNIGFSYSGYYVIDEYGKNLGVVRARPKILYKHILRNNYIGCLTAIYDTKKLGKQFMSQIRKRQDWVLWIKIIKILGEVKGIEEPLAEYTNRKNSISSNKLGLVKYTWIIYRNELRFSVLKSVFHIFQFLFYYARKKIFD